MYILENERADSRLSRLFERGGYRQRLSPEWKEDHARCALSPEPSRREAVGDLADPRTLEARWEMQGERPKDGEM